MKIYNIKGFIGGILFTALGIINLSFTITSPEDFLPKQIKDLVIAVLCILIGIGSFIRAFSKQATRQDIIKDHDERNKLVALKASSLTLKILYGCLIVSMVGGVVGHKLTANTAWIPVYTVSALLLGFLTLVQLIVSFYYEKRI
ncbi:DUF2178 domain-containing protein [Paenibacillus sanguinis]|uniref:DUF2178 domain-containing protein n=1 Tax=Paenibacillus sanguinis TaxID=225906 RepID=UPI00036A34EE|nr:DUF2178 domain-containing protein [Paenibacillus sanguinis]